MASELVEIADAVVADLNAQLSGWGFSGVTAERKYAPSFDIKETTPARVTVIPRRTEQSLASTQSNGYTHVVDVDVRRAITIGGETASCDEMTELAEHIADHCLGLSLSDPEGKCTEVTQDTAFEEVDASERLHFRTNITLSFQIWRAPR